MKKRLFLLAVFGMACAAAAAQPKASQTVPGVSGYGKGFAKRTLNEKGECVYESYFRSVSSSRQLEGHRKNGRKDGKWTYRTDDTQVEANYKEGVRHGRYTYRYTPKDTQRAVRASLEFNGDWFLGRMYIHDSIQPPSVGALLGKTDAQGRADNQWKLIAKHGGEEKAYYVTYSHGKLIRSSVDDRPTDSTDCWIAGLAHLVSFMQQEQELFGRDTVPTEAQKEHNLHPTCASDTVAASEKVYDFVKVMPEFPGGEEALRKYLKEQVEACAGEQYHPGFYEERVIVQFVVRKDGSITNIRVAKSLDPYFDRESIRIVKAMPKWKPGRKDGKPVNVRFFVPIGWEVFP